MFKSTYCTYRNCKNAGKPYDRVIDSPDGICKTCKEQMGLIQVVEDDFDSNDSSEEEFEIEEIKTINITDIADVHDDNSDKVASPSSVINSDVNTIHLEDEVIEVNSELIQEATLDKLNVKELKEKVIEAGGKPGKMNKGELIEYLQANN